MERILFRPILHWKRVLWNTIICVLITLIIALMSDYFLRGIFGISFSWFIIWMGILGVIIVLKRIPIAIFLVRVYQRYAPSNMRLACRYHPSCSEYMILSLQKYGFILGGWRGVKRIVRCRAPNGGIDYP